MDAERTETRRRNAEWERRVNENWERREALRLLAGFTWQWCAVPGSSRETAHVGHSYEGGGFGTLCDCCIETAAPADPTRELLVCPCCLAKLANALRDPSHGWGLAELLLGEIGWRPEHGPPRIYRVGAELDGTAVSG